MTALATDFRFTTAQGTVRIDAINRHGDFVASYELPGTDAGDELVQDALDVFAERYALDPERILREFRAYTAIGAAVDQVRADAVCADDDRYTFDSRGMSWNRPTRDGAELVLLANFCARIAGEVIEDDGVETRTTFDIEATVGGRTHTFRVPASDFGHPRWIDEHLGADAVIEPGQGLQSRVFHAIRLRLAARRVRRRVYLHTGWTRVNGVPAYLHGGGAIGPDGVIEGIDVQLGGDLERYALRLPDSRDQIEAGARAELQLLDVAPARLIVPVIASAFRAALGHCGCVPFFHGTTGTGKTELAALAQQHFGPAMDAEHLPANWDSTANALGDLAFRAADAVLVIDDFLPARFPNPSRAFAELDRVIRGVANHQGRRRMRSDATLRAERPARGLVIVTAEESPHAESAVARCVMLGVGQGDVDFDQQRGEGRALTIAQNNAREGLLAAFVAAFVRHVAREGIRDKLPGLRRAARDAMRGESFAHARIAGNVGELAVGWSAFVDFLDRERLVDADAARELQQLGRETLVEVGRAQARFVAEASPPARFLSLLTSAIASGAAHVAGMDGRQPATAPAGWGWRDGHPQGRCVGWTDGEQLYLEPSAALAAAKAVGQSLDAPLSASERALSRMLAERGMLSETGTDGRHLKPKRSIAGQRRRVLVLRADSLSSISESGACGAGDDRPRDSGPEGAPLAAPLDSASGAPCGARVAAPLRGIRGAAPQAPLPRERVAPGLSEAADPNDMLPPVGDNGHSTPPDVAAELLAWDRGRSL